MEGFQRALSGLYDQTGRSCQHLDLLVDHFVEDVLAVRAYSRRGIVVHPLSYLHGHGSAADIAAPGQWAIKGALDGTAP